VIVILLIGLLLTATAAALFVRAVALSRGQALRTLAQIRTYGFRPADERSERQQLRLSAQLDALAGAIGGVFARKIESFREDELRAQLQAAGIYTTSPRKFIGYRLLLTIFLPVFWLWLASSGGFDGLRTTVGFAFALAFGWLGPMTFIRRRARLRLEKIDEDMPELIDLLVTMVEAGVGFSGSLQLAATRLRGPLGDELRLAVQEQNMGLGTEQALENMVTRTPTPATRSFVRSIIQGETLGVSIGKIMRDLALEMRKRRRQVAEERAQKAPTKMLFPLIFLIFPAMFVVLLGPAAIQILHSLAGTAK
jgi:tight adherence protein C